MNCFRLNETTRRNILNYGNDLELTTQIRVVQFYWNLLFASTSMVMNALLIVVIRRLQNSPIKISPLLLCNSIVDFLFATAYFFHGRYIFIGYQRLFPLPTGLFYVQHPTYVYSMYVFMSMLTVASWNIITAQFVYRLLLVRYNEKPYGRRLYCFLTFYILLTSFHCFVMINSNLDDLTSEDREDSAAILNYYGFDIRPENIIGKILKPKPPTVLTFMPTFLSLFGFVLIVVCAIAIRRILRRSAGMKSVRTKRLNQSMDRTIVSMAIIPVISNMVPSFIYPSLFMKCQSNAIYSLVLSTFTLSVTFLNPLVTIVFIKTYREAIFRLLTFGYCETSQQTKSTNAVSTANNHLS